MTLSRTDNNIIRPFFGVGTDTPRRVTWIYSLTNDDNGREIILKKDNNNNHNDNILF